MPSIHDLVEPPVEPALHPRVQFWVRQATDKGGRLVVHFERKRDGLTFRPARFVVSVVAPDGRLLTSDSEPWDEQVDDDLIESGAPARDEENEIERFGFAFKTKLRPVEVRYGDGYFDSVLVSLLEREGFTNYERVRDCLARIATYTPSSPSYEDCYQAIRAKLGGAGRSLRHLGYAAKVAERVLAHAVAYYLDERFNVTNRKMLGW